MCYNVFKYPRESAHGETAAALKIQLLGEFRCWRAGKLIALQQWKTTKIRALLALLLSEHGQVFTRAQLANQLWPDSEDALALVRRRISELRHILEPKLRRASQSQYIVRRSHGYCFNPEVRCWVDTEEFACYEHAGHKAEQARDWPAAIGAYTKAAQFYRGEYLAGDEGEWVQQMRSFWRERFLYVMTRLAECYAQLGQYPQALEACYRALQVDPLYEECHRRLMLYSYHWGERARALKVYEEYRRRLADELGLSPSPQIEELYQQILAGAVPSPQKLPAASPPVLYSLHLPFVGREAESAQLQKYLQDAQAGHGQVVLLCGEPGVGKTRLAQEILHKLQENGALVLWGRCRDNTSDSPFAPLAEAMNNSLSRLSVEDLSALKPVWLAEIATLAPKLHALMPTLPVNPPLPPEQAPWRLFHAVAQFLTVLAQSRRYANPIVLWVDDLHWAAPSLLKLLTYLSRHIADQPICILGAYRSTDVTADHPLRTGLLTSHRPIRHITLAPLPYTALEQMLTRIGLSLSPHLCHHIYRESKGNPLFVTALLRDLLARKVLTIAADGTWACKRRFTPSRIREIEELVQQQCARLRFAEVRLLQLAAVLGESFTAEMLKQLRGRSESELSQSLSRLREAGLLTVTGSGLRYEFAHDRFREIVYDGISFEERKLLHRRIAQAIERLYRLEVSEHSARLAFHYERAEEWPAALRYSLDALERAVAQYHYDTALQMAEIGLRAAKKLAQPETIFKVLLKRVAIYHRLGRRTEQKRDIKALFELKRKLGEKPSVSLEIEAYRARAVFCRAVGCYSEGIEAAQQMLTPLQKTKDRSQEAKALLLLGSCYWVWGRYAEALQYAQRARALSRAIGDHESLGDALHLLGQIHAHRGMHRDAGRYYRYALQVRRKIGDQAGIAYSTNNLGNHYRAVGDYQKAFDAYRRSLALYEEMGNEQGHGRVLSDMADLYYKLGSYEKSLQYAQEALEIQESVRDLDNKAQTVIVKGHALEGLGQAHKALRCYQQAQALFERVKDVRGICHALNSISSVQVKLAQVHQALHSCVTTLSRLKAIGAHDVQIECLTGMGLAYLKCKKKARALACTRQAVDLLKQGFGHIAPHETYFVHYQALRAHGRHAEAREYLRKAYEELMRRARSIRDRTLRESFLSLVETNRVIIEAWRNTRL